jgi:hypothetical protein
MHANINLALCHLVSVVCTPVVVSRCSEQRLADAVWPQPVNKELFARLVQPHLAALAAAGQEITDVRKAPDKVGGGSPVACDGSAASRGIASVLVAAWL